MPEIRENTPIIEVETRKKYSDTENFNRAMEYANHKACQNISDDNKKRECEDYARILEASKKSEKSLCENISDENKKRECEEIIVEKSAVEQKDKKICEDITTETNKKRCRETIDGEKLKTIVKEGKAHIKECEELENNFQTECMKFVKNYTLEENYINALQSQNIGLCVLIGDADFAAKCRDEIIFKKAENEENISLCHEITAIDTKNICIQKVKKQHDKMYFKIATESENIAMCARISDISHRESCEDIINLSNIKKTNNYSLCSLLHREENKISCQKLQNS